MRFLLMFAVAPFWFQTTEETVLFTKFETCDNALIKIHTSFKTINNRYQLLNANYSAPIMNGENLKATFKAEYLVGSIWVPLFTFTENKGVCTLMIKYIGPLIADIMQAAALIPQCPIPKGSFMLRKYKPNADKLRLQLPNGQIRAKLIGIEKASGNVGFCVDLNVISNFI